MNPTGGKESLAAVISNRIPQSMIEEIASRLRSQFPDADISLSQQELSGFDFPVGEVSFRPVLPQGTIPTRLPRFYDAVTKEVREALKRLQGSK